MNIHCTMPEMLFLSQKNIGLKENDSHLKLTLGFIIEMINVTLDFRSIIHHLNLNLELKAMKTFQLYLSILLFHKLLTSYLLLSLGSESLLI